MWEPLPLQWYKISFLPSTAKKTPLQGTKLCVNQALRCVVMYVLLDMGHANKGTSGPWHSLYTFFPTFSWRAVCVFRAVSAQAGPFQPFCSVSQICSLILCYEFSPRSYRFILKDKKRALIEDSVQAAVSPAGPQNRHLCNFQHFQQ